MTGPNLEPTMNVTSSSPRTQRSSFAMAIAARANYESSILASMSGDTERAAAMMADAQQDAFDCGFHAFTDGTGMPATLNESASLANCWASGNDAARRQTRLAA